MHRIGERVGVEPAGRVLTGAVEDTVGVGAVDAVGDVLADGLCAGVHDLGEVGDQELAAIVPTILAAELSATEYSRQVSSGERARDPADHAAEYLLGLKSIEWLSANFFALERRLEPLMFVMSTRQGGNPVPKR